MAQRDWHPSMTIPFCRKVKKGLLCIVTDTGSWGGPCILQLLKIAFYPGGWTFHTLMARRFDNCDTAERYASEHFPELGLEV